MSGCDLYLRRVVLLFLSVLSDQLFSSAVETDNQLIELLMNESLNRVHGEGEGEGEGCLWVSFCHCFSLYEVELSVYNCVSRDSSVTYRSETGDRLASTVPCVSGYTRTHLCL